MSKQTRKMPNNKKQMLSDSRYIINGIFNFPAIRDQFVAKAIHYCFTANDTQIGAPPCWNCCGPRAFSYALLIETKQMPKLLSPKGTIYLAEDTFTYHIFGKAKEDTNRALNMLRDTEYN